MNGHIKRQHGFTLVEIALALLVISLISVGLMYAFGQQFKNTKYKDSAASLLYSKKALLNFVQLNGYLPCPDTNGDGVEDRSGLACSTSSGTLPYKDLGLTHGAVRDSWGHDIRYYTVQNVTNAAQICSTSPVRYSANYFCKVNAPIFDSLTPPTASSTDASNLDILDAAGSSAIATQMSVILVAANNNSGAPCATLSADEQENCDGDRLFVQHDRTDTPFFDDQLITISGYEIKRPQLFTASTLTGTPTFLSKFKDEHTKLYNALQAQNATGEDATGGTNWISRLISEDARLFQSEKLMLYDNACAVKPDVFNDSNNYSIINTVDSEIILDSGDYKPNLLVNNSINRTGKVTGRGENNSIFINNEFLGYIDLGPGNNEIVIAGNSAGYIYSSYGNDKVRVCGDSIKTTVLENEVSSSLRLNFDNSNRSTLSRDSWIFCSVAFENGYGVDALVEVVDSHHATVATIDYQPNDSSLAPGFSRAFQPVIAIQPQRNILDYWVEFKISFYKSNSSSCSGKKREDLGVPVYLSRLTGTAADIDGNYWGGYDHHEPVIPPYGDYREYVEMDGFSNDSVWTEYDTHILTTITGGRVHAIPADYYVLNGVHVTNDSHPDATKHMFTAIFSNQHSFHYRAGILYGEGSPVRSIERYYSLYFDPVTYESPHEVVIEGLFDLGEGDDEILIGGDIDRNVYLGSGNNYGYFFNNARQKVIGTDGDDFVTALGDLGWPEPEPNSEGWDLKGGDNSARVKGSCYAPIVVGDGDDLFIVSGDTERECEVNTNGGNDLILIDGTLNTALNTGAGDDFAVIHATGSNARVLFLGDGNDTLVVETLLYSNIEAGDGDDKIVLQAGADNSVTLIEGGAGEDVLEVSMTQDEWSNSDLQYRISGIETVKLIDAQITIP